MWVIVKDGILQQYSENRISEIALDEEGNEFPHSDLEVNIEFSTFDESAWDWSSNPPIDISQTPDYIAEQNKKTIQQAKQTRDTAINEITNAKLLDDLQLDAGTITQTIYNARKTARLAQLAEVNTTFYTTTGLTQPTTITA